MELIGTLLSTLFGAVAGAYFAFRFEWYRESREHKRGLVAAGNTALFILVRQLSKLKSLTTQCLDPYRNQPARWMNLPQTRPESFAPELAPDSLLFLIDAGKPQLLDNLMVGEMNFREALETLRQRYEWYGKLLETAFAATA